MVSSAMRGVTKPTRGCPISKSYLSVRQDSRSKACRSSVGVGSRPIQADADEGREYGNILGSSGGTADEPDFQSVLYRTL